MTAPQFAPTAVYFLTRADALVTQATTEPVDTAVAPYLFRGAELCGELARIAAEYPESVA